MKDLGIGFRGYANAFSFAWRNGMWWMFLVPIALGLAFSGGILWLSNEVVDRTGAYLSGALELPVGPADGDGSAGFWDDVKGFFNSTRVVLVAIVVKLALWFLFGLVGKYLVLILLSPLLAYASERTEEILTGRSYPFRLVQLLKDAGRGIRMALRNGFLELAVNLGVWTLTIFVPIAAPVSVVFLWFVSSWYYGFSMYDYVYERHRLGISASAQAARRQRGMVLANGILFDLLMKVPLIGVVFAPLLASIGAVLAWQDANRVTREG